MLGAAVNAAALLAATAGLFVQCVSACCSAPTPLHPRPRCPPGATLLLLPTCCAVGGQPVYSLERPEACSCSTRVHTPALTSRGPEVGGGDWAGARWGQAGRVHTGLCIAAVFQSLQQQQQLHGARLQRAQRLLSLCKACTLLAMLQPCRTSTEPTASSMCAMRMRACPFTHLCCRPPPRPPGACAAEPLAPS